MEKQRKVFGLGYPSVPVYTVDEWFDKMSKNGGFGGGNAKKPPKNYTIDDNEKEDTLIEDALDEESLEQQRQHQMRQDEWRDEHRRGWGNTYNKG